MCLLNSYTLMLTHRNNGSSKFCKSSNILKGNSPHFCCDNVWKYIILTTFDPPFISVCVSGLTSYQEVDIKKRSSNHL